MDNICRNLLDVMIMIDDIIEMNKSLYSKALKTFSFTVPFSLNKKNTTNLSFTDFGIYGSPLSFWLILSTIITGLWPVDFPFKIFISGNLAGFQFFFSKSPFFQKIIKNPIIKPHTNRWVSRPTIGIMVADSGILTGIRFSPG